MQSSLGRNPRSVHTPFDNAATITARCEMLLSPGTLISMSIRGARFTRNSIENEREQYWMLTAACLMKKPNCVNPASGMQDPASTQQDKFHRCYGTRKILSV
jgi:hypothetical protein